MRRALGVKAAFTISTDDGYELPKPDQEKRRLRTEREQIRGRVDDMLRQIEALNL